MSLGYPFLMQNWMLSKINWDFPFVPGVRGTPGDVTVQSPVVTRHRSVNKVIGSSEVGCHVKVYVAKMHKFRFDQNIYFCGITW